MWQFIWGDLPLIMKWKNTLFGRDILRDERLEEACFSYSEPLWRQNDHACEVVRQQC